MHKGFIYCLLLTGPNAGQALTEEQLADWKPEDGLLWVHLKYKSTDARHWISKQKLEVAERDTLLASDTRPRVVHSNNGILLTLRGVNLNPNSDPEDMVSIRIYIEEHRIISTCERQLQSIVEVAESIKASKGPFDSAGFILSVAEHLTQRQVGYINKLEELMDELEERVVTDTNKSLRMDIAELRRQTVVLRRYLAPQREALGKILHENSLLLDHNDKIKLRETQENLIRVIEDLDAIRDRASVTQEELQSRQAEQLNQRLYFLSLISAVFLPLGFLTGLLGVNIGGIPGAETDWAFAAFCAGLLTLIGLQMYVFYRLKWI
ncbi:MULTISPECIES: zinc transporter ZntB [Pseudomonadati]|jgi:zinc transporter|uniref:Zinc transporter ZntB n=1 Tax=Shewanella aestuarii TaxID=1028752 RepID=A0ABT0L290_9GAMM|nr:zinc transporter ZntB [Shewanella aestuarii]MCL1117590.1 zinc transporter ZntB [Shewanella aestuarii]GGN75232.1 zinc transporter ZntB [Shewanella aestuarii]